MSFAVSATGGIPSTASGLEPELQSTQAIIYSGKSFWQTKTLFWFNIAFCFQLSSLNPNSSERWAWRFLLDLPQRACGEVGGSVNGAPVKIYLFIQQKHPGEVHGVDSSLLCWGFKGIDWHFGKYANWLSCWELEEKVNTTLMSVHLEWR